MIFTNYKMSFLNIFKSKSKKQEDKKWKEDNDPPPVLERRYSISKSGTMKQRKVRPPITQDFVDSGKDNLTMNNYNQMKQLTKNKSDEDKDDNINEDEVVKDIMSIVNSHSRLETAL